MSRFDGASLLAWVFLPGTITDTFAKKTFRYRNFPARKRQITDTSVKNGQCFRNRRGFEHKNGLKLRIHRAKIADVSVMLLENTAKNVSCSKGGGERWSESAGRREQQHDKKRPASALKQVSVSVQIKSLETRDARLLELLVHIVCPDGSLNFADVCLFEEEHAETGLADTAADRERHRAFSDELVELELHSVFCVCSLELGSEGLGVYADTH